MTGGPATGAGTGGAQDRAPEPEQEPSGRNWGRNGGRWQLRNIDLQGHRFRDHITSLFGGQGISRGAAGRHGESDFRLHWTEPRIDGDICLRDRRTTSG